MHIYSCLVHCGCVCMLATNHTARKAVCVCDFFDTVKVYKTKIVRKKGGKKRRKHLGMPSTLLFISHYHLTLLPILFGPF